jgi:hypothetical protein
MSTVAISFLRTLDICGSKASCKSVSPQSKKEAFYMHYKDNWLKLNQVSAKHIMQHFCEKF